VQACFHYDLRSFLCKRYADGIMVISTVVTTRRKFIRSGVAQTPSEARRRERAIAGTDAAMAVAFLNMKKSRAVQNVLEIRQQLADLAAMADALRGEKRQFQASDIGAQHKHLASLHGFDQRLQEVNRRLASYTFVPMVACTSFDTYRWCYQSAPKSQRGPIVPVSDGSLTVAVGESQAATALARLFARAELRTVHLCDNCRANWHIAPRSIDRFCSKECRENWHTKSPNYAEKRREIQKRYRDNLKRTK